METIRMNEKHLQYVIDLTSYHKCMYSVVWPMYVCCPGCFELLNDLVDRDRQLMFWMTMSQSAVTAHSSKTNSPTSLKGKLCKEGIQFHLSFNKRPPGMQEWKKQDWEGKKAKEIETYRGEIGGSERDAGEEQKAVKMNAWSSVSRKQREKERWWVQGTFSSPLSLFPSRDIVVIYCRLSSPHGLGGKWALNWVSIHHLLTLMLVVLECLHLMFLFKINYLQSI